jgi:hypothetical protein
VGRGVISLELKEIGAFVITYFSDYREFRIGGAISPFHMYICAYAFVAFNKGKRQSCFSRRHYKDIYISSWCCLEKTTVSFACT